MFDNKNHAINSKLKQVRELEGKAKDIYREIFRLEREIAYIKQNEIPKTR